MKKVLLIILLLCIPVALAEGVEPTQQYVKIFLNPYYTEIINKEVYYVYNLSFFVPDGLSEVVMATVNFNLYATSSPQNFDLLINSLPCNNPSFQARLSGFTTISYDCSNVFDQQGVYNLTLYTTKDSGGAIGWLEITYVNNPKGLLDVMGTEYTFGDRATVFLQLKDSQGYPITNGHCYLDIYTPELVNSSHIRWFYDTPMLFLNNSDGLYYYDLNSPNSEGIYMLSATCSYSYDVSWCFPPEETVEYPLRTVLAGSYSGSEVNLNSLEDWIYTSCTSAGGATKYCDAFYDFNVSRFYSSNITDLNVYYAGESTASSLLYQEYFNWTGNNWVVLPNSLTFGATASGSPSGINDYLSNDISNVYEAINSSSLMVRVRLRGQHGNVYEQFDNWVSLKMLTAQGTIQDLKGSGELHITKYLSSIYDAVANSSLKGLHDKINNYTTITDVGQNFVSPESIGVAGWFVKDFYSENVLIQLYDCSVGRLTSTGWAALNATLYYYIDNYVFWTDPQNLSLGDVYDLACQLNFTISNNSKSLDVNHQWYVTYEPLLNQSLVIIDGKLTNLSNILLNSTNFGGYTLQQLDSGIQFVVNETHYFFGWNESFNEWNSTLNHLFYLGLVNNLSINEVNRSVTFIVNQTHYYLGWNQTFIVWDDYWDTLMDSDNFGGYTLEDLDDGISFVINQTQYFYHWNQSFSDWNETFNVILYLTNQTFNFTKSIANDTGLIQAIKNDTTNILDRWGSVTAQQIKEALDNILLEIRPIRQLASNPPLSSEQKFALDSISGYVASNLEAIKQSRVESEQRTYNLIWIGFIVAIILVAYAINYLRSEGGKKKFDDEMGGKYG